MLLEITGNMKKVSVNIANIAGFDSALYHFDSDTYTVTSLKRYKALREYPLRRMYDILFKMGCNNRDGKFVCYVDFYGVLVPVYRFNGSGGYYIPSVCLANNTVKFISLLAEHGHTIKTFKKMLNDKVSETLTILEKIKESL